MAPDSFFNSGGGQDDAAFPEIVKYSIKRIVWSPAVDIYETETEIVAVAEIPGVSYEDVIVKLRNGALIIEGEKNKMSELKGLSFFCVERSYGKFERRFRIISPVDESRIEKSFSDGVLTVTLFKKK
ncbi:MAG: Hsp20/alpha crystallin family protein [bacterium]